MGGRAGAGGGLNRRGGLSGDVGSGRTTIKNVETLKNIKDPALYKEMSRAIGRYYAVMGLEERNVKLADLGKTTLGVAVVVDGDRAGVYLNKKDFKNATKAEVTNAMKSMYKSGWQTKTNKPVAHVITHELAHTTWNSHLKGEKYKQAGKEINKVYRAWLKDNRKTGYGRYSRTNVNEFWAETITKAVHGKADKYTRKLKSIAKKYNL